VNIRSARVHADFEPVEAERIGSVNRLYGTHGLAVTG
jgi:hypothetical protein